MIATLVVLAGCTSITATGDAPTIPTGCAGISEAPTMTGRHAVLPRGADAACPVHLTQGTYGVAIYTISTPGLAISEALNRRDVEIAVFPAHEVPMQYSGASSVLATTRTMSAEARLNGFSRACEHPKMEAREGIALGTAAGTAGIYTVQSASAHFAVAYRVEDLARASTEQQTNALIGAALLEHDVLPFLERSFGALPDVDNNGQTIIAVAALGSGISGKYLPGGAGYGDGCAGDLVFLDPSTLARINPRAQVPPGFQSVALHEMIHHIDDVAGSLPGKADWSIEAYAALGQQLFAEELGGIDFWSDLSGDICGPGCSLSMLAEGRYGAPGLAAGEATNGASIFRYLLSQSLPKNTPPYKAFGLLRNRGSGRDIMPSWLALGGSGRSEAELEGEFLLMFYADSRIPGISSRLENATFNLPRLTSSPYPLRAFTLDASSVVRQVVPLATPDGVVFELHVPAGGAYLQLTRGSALFAIVKAA